jgi:hypothetical protein
MISTKMVVAGLVAVNVLLGAALVARFGIPEQKAYGQLGGGQPVHAVGGVVRNMPTFFIFDPASGNIIVVQADTAKNGYIPLDRIPVVKDLQSIK